MNSLIDEKALSKSIKYAIENVVKEVIRNSHYTKDNLLCYAISLQPHFLVWSSSIILHDELRPQTKEIALENAKEEFFGCKDEGSHAMLSRVFFKQIGNLELIHYQKTEIEIQEIYYALNKKERILVLIACIETWSSLAMDEILNSMKNYGATDFSYVEIHKTVDNLKDGHGFEFIRALDLENLPDDEVQMGIKLFKNLFLKIFD